MFDMSSKAQNQADKFLKDQQTEHIKNSVFVDQKTIEVGEMQLFYRQLKTIFEMKLLSAKYFKGTFTEFIKFYVNTRCCCICQDQFKPKSTPEKIYASYIKNRSQTHYRSQD